MIKKSRSLLVCARRPELSASDLFRNGRESSERVTGHNQQTEDHFGEGPSRGALLHQAVPPAYLTTIQSRDVAPQALSFTKSCFVGFSHAFDSESVLSFQTKQKPAIGSWPLWPQPLWPRLSRSRSESAGLFNNRPSIRGCIDPLLPMATAGLTGGSGRDR